jgi:hypothetical protein
MNVEGESNLGEHTALEKPFFRSITPSECKADSVEEEMMIGESRS